MEDHDGVVELSSQKAGLEGYKSTVEDAYGADCFRLSSPAHHCNTTSWKDTHENLVKLLSKSVDSYVFSKTGYVDMNSAQSGNSKRMAPARPVRQLKPADNADTFVRIANHDIEIVNDSIFLSLTIDKSDDIASTLLMSRLDDDHNLVAVDCSSARMVLPFHLPGEYTLTLLGRTDDFAITCDTIHYNIPVTATPEYLMFDDTPSYLIVGQKVACSTKITWDNQQTTFVNADLQSSDESVVKVSNGTLKAVGAGECVLTATWEGNIADMIIKVEDYGQSTAISVIRQDTGVDFALSDDKLILKTTPSMNGLDIGITLYDINGEVLKTINAKATGNKVTIPVNDIKHTFIATCIIDGNVRATRKFHR